MGSSRFHAEAQRRKPAETQRGIASPPVAPKPPMTKSEGGHKAALGNTVVAASLASRALDAFSRGKKGEKEEIWGFPQFNSANAIQYNQNMGNNLPIFWSSVSDSRQTALNRKSV